MRQTVQNLGGRGCKIDYGCRHYKTAIICGVSEPRYSAEELRRLDEQDKRLYKVGDIGKDGYSWSQSMRAIEADIRKSKDEINALSALGGNESKIKELKNRIKTFQGKYDEISDITGIAKEKRRLTIQKLKIDLTTGGDRGTIKETSLARIPQVPSSTITRKIDSGEYSTKISHQQYQKHVMGTAKYNEYLSIREKNGDNPQSILTITEKEAQEIIKSKAGTGMVRVTRKGEPTPKEDITCEKVIGKYYGKGEYHDTQKATIHYGKKSAHIVPIKGDNYD